MSKKDYVLIASVVREIPSREDRIVVAESFARKLAQDNAAFQASRFLSAAVGA